MKNNIQFIAGAITGILICGLSMGIYVHKVVDSKYASKQEVDNVRIDTLRVLFSAGIIHPTQNPSEIYVNQVLTASSTEEK